jgi:hypothetical protein
MNDCRFISKAATDKTFFFPASRVYIFMSRVGGTLCTMKTR